MDSWFELVFWGQGLLSEVRRVTVQGLRDAVLLVIQELHGLGRDLVHLQADSAGDGSRRELEVLGRVQGLAGSHVGRGFAFL